MDAIQHFVPKNAENSLMFFVNGKKVIVPNPDPSWTLLWYIRNELQLTGTKQGCGEGGCGACTVMLSWYLPDADRVKHIAVNACLTPLCSVYGMAVTTVEGIGSVENGIHPVQERIAKSHGSQCGFCTPGFVMSMYTLLRNKNNIEYADIDTALQGNLCRCTGYRPIIDGFKTFLEAWDKPYANGGTGKCMLGDKCCKVKQTNNPPKLFEKSKFQPYDPMQEPIFPPELKILHSNYKNKFLFFQSKDVAWMRPKSIDELLAIKSEIPESKIVAGNTEIGVEVKFKNMIYHLMICPNNIEEIKIVKKTKQGYLIGSLVPLTELMSILDKEVRNNPKEAKVYSAIEEMLHWFAGTQVRNVATLAGNIVTASPISDINPILMASSAKINVRSKGNADRKINIDENFFLSYRKTSIKADELVVNVEIPFSEENQYFKAYKQARRKDDDISIVTSAFNVKVDALGNIVEARLCFGGMGPTTVLAAKTSKAIIGQKWNKIMLNSVFAELVNEFDLDASAPGGMAEYRKSLCLSMFFKFYSYVSNNLNNKSRIDCNDNYKYELLQADEVVAVEPQSSQYFDIKDTSRQPTNSVGLPVPHVSAVKHATGEALYCDDIPHVQGELFLTVVPSSRAHARIVSIDAKKALSIPGVVAFLTAADLKKDCNKSGPIFKDEEIFSSKVVTSRACIVGALVAETESIARKAKLQVEVVYEDLEPVIITIEDAIEHKSYFPGSPRILIKGNFNEVLSTADYVVEGTARSGAQEHFYLEPFCAFAKRKEDELEIVASTQSPAELAVLISQALQIPNHKVVAKTKRLGGGFGGKETRSSVLAVPVAVAAYILKKPVRAVLDRDEDMQISGYRHPVLTKYTVAFSKDGIIIGAKFDVFINAGNSMDISCSMMERVVMHVDNSYSIPNIEINGYICKTNLPSNTAFRGFGGPQAMFATEHIIRDVASTLGKSYEEIVDINMYREGDLTHFNQKLSYCTLRRCWSECMESSKYWIRKQEINEFNKSNRWKKKGLAMVPTKYGISFQSDFLMQGGALLMIYTDGSVLLSIGGIEMGQGLFTKMIQVASKALEVDIERIHISEMSTDKVPNSSPTAASISSDIYGMAVLQACETLMERLKPYKVREPAKKWEDWVSAAYFDRVNLSATGFYCAPKISYNPETNTGNLYEYFTYGVACSEVIVDCLTGDHSVLRTDIVMDLGESLNPAIDIGQIEGAFMQGYGMFTIEDVVYSPTGALLSRGPGAYKIPAISDIPKEFNVSLLKGAPNPRAVYASKAVGEPPLFLAASTFFAIKEAIKSARKDAGVKEDFEMDAPATCAKIRMACDDDITRQVVPTIKSSGKLPWSVTL